MIRIAAHCTAEQLAVLVRAQRDAAHRDRLRVVEWAMRGMPAVQIAELLGYSVPWVWTCVRRFNEHGPEGLDEQPRPGRPRALSPEQDERLSSFVGARAQDPAHARRLHGVAAREFIERDLGVPMSLSAAYATLHRLGYELIKPRPRHEKNDPDAMEQWKTVTAPLLSKKRDASTRAKSSISGARTNRASAKKAR